MRTEAGDPDEGIDDATRAAFHVNSADTHQHTPPALLSVLERSMPTTLVTLDTYVL
jgi:hypothetical protein